MPFCKTLQATLALIVVLLSSHAVVAQQWPVGQVPVENAVPQYRPRSVQPNLPSNPARNSAGALPLDFFGNQNPSVLPEIKPAIEQPSLPRPVISQPAAPKQELLEVNPIRPQMNKPEVVKPKVDKPTTPTQPKTPTAEKKTVKKNEAQKKVAKKKEKPKPRPVLTNDIYRDQSVFPIDPRKPNWPCAGGNCRQGCQCKSCLALGNHGRPYRERELGGCECDSCKPTKHPNFSVHWPRPFSAKIDARHPEAANARYSGCQEKRIVDVFDGLASFKLIDYKRTDNGYCGPGSDRYGCLGESKMK